MKTRLVHLGATVLSGGLLIVLPRDAVAQTVPTPGVTGTIAPEATVEQEQAAARAVLSRTKEGVEHAFHFAKNLLLHGGKDAGIDALSGLREGTTVVVRDGVAGVTEARVIHVDRARAQIEIRLEGGKTETLQLADAAADDPRVSVSYADEAGHQITHVFKRMP